MLDNFTLLAAMQDIREDYLLDTARFLGYSGAEARHPLPKKAMSFLLIAAILLALFSASAYALGWFGLSRRLSPAPADAAPIAPEYGDPSDHSYLSYSGTLGSAAMRASLEWREYCENFQKTEAYQQAALPENEQEFLRSHPAWRAYHDIYGVVTEDMADKLLALAAEYGVRLHSAVTTPEDDGQFYRLAHMGRFLLREEGEYEFQCYALYEDGSFRGFGFLPFEGVGYPFTFVKSANDVLDPTVQELYGSALYEEWQYTTEAGALVNIASWDWGHPEKGNSLTWVFYEEGATLLTVFGTTPLGRESCEAFADCFDFAAAAK